MKKSNAAVFECAGKALTIREWSDELGISQITLRHRLRSGWSLDRVFGQPVDPSRRTYEKRQVLHFRNEDKSVYAWAKELGLSYGTIMRRLDQGWSVEQALSTPAGRQEKTYTVNGVSRTVNEWSRELGTSASSLRLRLSAGWSVERTFTTGALKKNAPMMLTFEGETHSLNQWGKRVGMSRALLSQRLKNGWDVGEALTRPVDGRCWQKTQWRNASAEIRSKSVA